jgi:hypothetical protein
MDMGCTQGQCEYQPTIHRHLTYGRSQAEIDHAREWVEKELKPSLIQVGHHHTRAT